MDPKKSAQDVIRCDLCETAIVQMYCDFCYVNLCISCIGRHISYDYDKHKVVPFKQRKSTLIYPKCSKHPTKCCEFQCKDCNISLCSFCTTMSDRHKKHIILTLLDLYNSKRKIIAKDTEDLENIISPTYDEIAIELETQITNLDGEYGMLIKTVSNQCEEWHREINIIIEKMKTEIEDIKLKHKSILKAHLDEIKMIQNLIEQTQVNMTRIEESNEVSKTLEYRSKNVELSKLPAKVQVLLPTFNPKPIDIKRFYKLIGSLTPLSTTTIENGYRLKKSSSKELLQEPELICRIDTRNENLRSVICQSEEEIWTIGRYTSDIKCFNSHGLIMKTIKTKSGKWPTDIAVNKDEDLVFSDAAVYKVKNGEIEGVIKVEGWVPINLAITSSNDLLVAMYSNCETQSKIVRFSGSTEIQTIQTDEEGKPLYSGNGKIKYISENRNLDICVADWEAGAVVVVNHDGKFRFNYTGHLLLAKDKSFKPFGIGTDSQSQILTADSDNHCIHILDQDGQFLGYVDNCRLKNPYGLYVDKNDYLFVAEYFSGNVKKIQYLY